jgi:hypothetical protein
VHHERGLQRERGAVAAGLDEEALGGLAGLGMNETEAAGGEGAGGEAGLQLGEALGGEDDREAARGSEHDGSGVQPLVQGEVHLVVGDGALLVGGEDGGADGAEGRVGDHQIEPIVPSLLGRPRMLRQPADVGAFHHQPIGKIIGRRPLAGQPGQPGLDLHRHARGGRIARQQQERDGAGAAADVEEATVGRPEEGGQQDGVEAGAETARRLDQSHPPAEERVVSERVAVLAHSGSVGRPSGSMRASTRPVASFG